MKIDRLILGEFQTNCYVARRSETDKDCLIIDAGLQPDQLVDFLKDRQLNPSALILTHGHIDHIGGLNKLRQHYPNLKVYIHPEDAEMLTGTKNNLSQLTGMIATTEPADFTLTDGQLIEQVGLKLKTIHTPGHTPGGICLYSKENRTAFVGDTLFADSVGRTDFPGGNMSQLLKSIKEKILTLPPETTVYPGHGQPTTIAREMAANPFLQ